MKLIIYRSKPCFQGKLYHQLKIFYRNLIQMHCAICKEALDRKKIYVNKIFQHLTQTYHSKFFYLKINLHIRNSLELIKYYN